MAFVVVGGLGLAVQLAVLHALTGWARLDYRLATALAVESAIVHNFVWHERWTWADRVTPLRGEVLGRLARFHLANGVVSLGGNVALTALFVGIFGLHYLPANLLAVGACVVLNYLAADRLVFASEV
ncbi:MAG: GtrA family protein [Vicinamibacterales bacterium]